MILEVADIRIQPGQQAAFDEAILRGLQTVIAQAKGYRGYKVNKGIESPERYLLMIFWDTLEDHTVGFRSSPAFAEWRAIVGHFFAVHRRWSNTSTCWDAAKAETDGRQPLPEPQRARARSGDCDRVAAKLPAAVRRL